MIQRFLFLFSLLFVSVLPSLAASPEVITVQPGDFYVVKGVNVRNGNFSVTYKTSNHRDTPSGIPFDRVYNSRSVYRGRFGLGWGSPFENKIDLKGGMLFIQENGTGATSSYRPQLSQGQPQSLKEIKIGLPYLVDGGTFEGDKCRQGSKIVREDDGIFVRYFGKNCPVAVEIYGIGGDLVGIGDYRASENASLKIIWDAKHELVTEIRDEKGKVTRFTYDAKKRLVRQEPPNGDWQKFEYDDRDNMTSITYLDDSKQTMTYDDKDRVLSVTPRRGPTVRFEYLQDPYDPKISISRVTSSDDDQKIIVFKLLN